jgi:nucleotide-binding universal stress UspA family protein
METTADTRAAEARRPARIVVLVDASLDALHALESAAELARRYGVPLLAVSVEEPDRVRSTRFSFAREIGALSGAIRPVDEGLLSRRRASAPASIRRAVERVGRAAGIEWSLEVVQGQLVESVLTLSEPGDALLLGRVGLSARLGRRLGGSSLRLARRAPGTVRLCAASPAERTGRIAVLVEGAGSSPDLLRTAVGYASVLRRELVVLLAPTAEASEVESLLAGLGPVAARSRLRTLSTLTTGDMLRALAEERAIELVAGRHADWLHSPAAARLLTLWRMPVLVTDGS